MTSIRQKLIDLKIGDTLSFAMRINNDNEMGKIVIARFNEDKKLEVWERKFSWYQPQEGTYEMLDEVAIELLRKDLPMKDLILVKYLEQYKNHRYKREEE